VLYFYTFLLSLAQNENCCSCFSLWEKNVSVSCGLSDMQNAVSYMCLEKSDIKNEYVDKNQLYETLGYFILPLCVFVNKVTSS
jgi:hypothetical protein